jgi:probable HAF family extracellular repeat protein
VRVVCRPIGVGLGSGTASRRLATLEAVDTPRGQAGDREAGRSGWRLSELELLPGGRHGSAVAVNDKGVVVGVSDTADDTHHAVLWRGGRIADLGTLGGWQSEPTGLNRHGVVVGWSETQPGRLGERRAFIWADDEMNDLGALAAASGEFVPAAINDDGLVVGSCRTTPASVWHAVVWKSGEMTDLGVLARGHFQSSHARDIDDQGRIVGEATVDNMNTVPVMWENGRIHRLTDQYGVASAINSRGQVTGNISSGPFVWSLDQVTEIGRLNSAMNTLADGIDRHGRVLGHADGHSFLWHRGQFEWLPNPITGHSTTKAISDDGRFVVGGTTSTPDLQTSYPAVWTRQ